MMAQRDKRLAIGVGGAAVLSIAWAQPVLALTAEELWGEWQALAASSGQVLEAGSVEDTGSGLRLSDLTLTTRQDDVETVLSMDPVTLTEAGDAIRIELSDDYGFTSTSNAEGETADLRWVLGHEGLDFQAKGTPDARAYAYLAKSMTLRLQEALVNGEPMPLEILLSAVDLASDYRFSSTDTTSMESDSTMGTVTMSVSFLDPETNEQGKFDYSARELAVASQGDIGTLANATDPADVFASGASAEVSMRHNGAVYTLDGSGPDGTFGLSGTALSGGIDILARSEGLTYTTSSTDMTLRMTEDTMPLPLEASIGSATARASLPIVPSETPQDFAVAIDLSQFQPSDSIWGLLDPSGTLPRDPANLALELTGKTRFDPEQMPLDDEPGLDAIDSFAIERFELEALGAKLTGTGSATVNGDAAGLAPGVPEMVGRLSLQAAGVNALLDGLVAAGIVGDDEMMGARMMLGMFAVPAPGEDNLQSEIEFLEGGGVSINGMRMR